MPKQRQLLVHSDFERMKVFKQPISVYLQSELIGENVVIQTHNEEIVLSTNGERYFKENCKFLSKR